MAHEQEKYKDIRPHLLSKSEQDALLAILGVIETPHNAQELMLSEKTPTLSIALPTYELLCEIWEMQKVKTPYMRPFICTGLDKLREYVLISRSNKVYALAMSTSTP